MALATAISVAFVNVCAIVFSRTSRRWVKVHQSRAGQVLKALSQNLLELKSDVDDSYGLRSKSHKRNSLFRSNLVLNYMHSVVALAAVILPLA